jgi:type III restriction enzyme
MLNIILQNKKNQWLQSSDCTIIDLIKYIRKQAQMRDTQIEAIETYLFLKIKGKNKPLYQLFAEGFFLQNNINMPELYQKNEHLHNFLEQNMAAKALYDFANTRIESNNKAQGKQKSTTKNSKNNIKDNSILLPEVANLMYENHETIDYLAIIKQIFYGVNYADYLMSLPMGAGKTYLMAAFIYLDLYFADKEPENKIFAHNFLILIPSGLKSSIAPSLKTIDKFQPSWIFPEPAASQLKAMLQLTILDESKSAKKSNKTRNPNAEKVNRCFPNPFGQVFVVNAEKVVIESFKFDAQLKLQLDKTEENSKDDNSNDLKKLFGKIPNLSILIDEVHHAATSDIKLRQAVNYWHEKGNITTVLGFSGTPYLQKAETISVENCKLKFSQITNTVYYYPLIKAIRGFLKTPTIKFAENLTRLEIIKNAISDFDNLYKNTVYANGTIAKMAIYCSSIAVLEEEVLPFLKADLQISEDEILKYHGGNKQYNLPKENELAFRSLDLAISKKRYILLVQVGKEGWDCRSLTSVVLSQQGDSPQNMVLQTACRCLREVDKLQENTRETALIWLNKANADILNEQLQKEQQTSIDEINQLQHQKDVETVARIPRTEYLELPIINFYKLQISYQALQAETHANTAIKLQNLLAELSEKQTNYKNFAAISTSQIDTIANAEMQFIHNLGKQIANYNQWIFEIAKQSFGAIITKKLHSFDSILQEIFKVITYPTPCPSPIGRGVLDDIQDVKNSPPNRGGAGGGVTIYFNDLYDLYAIATKIRLAFHIKRNLQTSTEIVPEEAKFLIINKLKPVETNSNLYPNETETAKIIAYDEQKADLANVENQAWQDFEKGKQALITAGLANMAAMLPNPEPLSLEVRSKDKSFHYLPYNFKDSNLELQVLQKTLNLAEFKHKNLEIYYNGERGLTEFVITCFAKENSYWKNIGNYTPDFLIIERKEQEKIHKILIVETKGAGFANDALFLKKKKYVETEFIEINKQKFNYQFFDFIYLEDSQDMNKNLAALDEKIKNFF